MLSFASKRAYLSLTIEINLSLNLSKSHCLTDTPAACECPPKFVSNSEHSVITLSILNPSTLRAEPL